jgi:hypothetical protein
VSSVLQPEWFFWVEPFEYAHFVFGAFCESFWVQITVIGFLFSVTVVISVIFGSIVAVALLDSKTNSLFVFIVVCVGRTDRFPEWCWGCSEVASVGVVDGFVDVVNYVFEMTFDIGESLVGV